MKVSWGVDEQSFSVKYFLSSFFVDANISLNSFFQRLFVVPKLDSEAHLNHRLRDNCNWKKSGFWKQRETCAFFFNKRQKTSQRKSRQ